MPRNPHDVVGFGEEQQEADLLDVIRDTKGSNPSPIVDFTFRLPPELLDEIKAMAREQGCSSNAMVASLLEVGLRHRGRQGIAERYPDYVRYLSRRRRP